MSFYFILLFNSGLKLKNSANTETKMYKIKIQFKKSTILFIIYLFPECSNSNPSLIEVNGSL